MSDTREVCLRVDVWEGFDHQRGCAMVDAPPDWKGKYVMIKLVNYEIGRCEGEHVIKLIKDK